MLKASFEVYSNAKGFDGILIMDKDINKFLYIGSPEDMERAADKLLVAFPSWTDTQSNAMKITLAKGTRGGASSGAAVKLPAPAADIGTAMPSVQPVNPIKAATTTPVGGTQELGRKRR